MLADGNEPLTLADGTKIDPRTGRKVSADTTVVEVPRHSEARKIVTETRRTIADLPDLPKTMTPINVVLTYELFGMSVEQIAVATQLPIEQINSIRQHDAYEKMREAVVENLVASSTDQVTQILRDGKLRAARKMVQLVDNPDEDVALRASSAVMTHAKETETRKSDDDQLVIVMKRKNDQPIDFKIEIGD